MNQENFTIEKLLTAESPHAVLPVAEYSAQVFQILFVNFIECSYNEGQRFSVISRGNVAPTSPKG